MNDPIISAASMVSGDDLRTARLGPRFGRMDLACQLALLAVESLGINFDLHPRERVGICLTARTGSLSTDAEYWSGLDIAGGLSPTLFTYTLPSAALGEIAIRHRLAGPNLCLVGEDTTLLIEAGDMIRRGEADACVCVFCDATTEAAAAFVPAPANARAYAVWVERGSEGMAELPKNSRDMASWFAKFCANNTGKSNAPCKSPLKT
jgi:3-oxoacyl-(acyl-carrier-protein) synthase